MKRFLILILLVMVFLAGCATPGERFLIQGPEITPQQIETINLAGREGPIKIGMTKDEVKELLGEPQLRAKGLVINWTEPLGLDNQA